MKWPTWKADIGLALLLAFIGALAVWAWMSRPSEVGIAVQIIT